MLFVTAVHVLALKRFFSAQTRPHENAEDYAANDNRTVEERDVSAVEIAIDRYDDVEE